MSNGGWFDRRTVLKMTGVAGIGASLAEAPKAKESEGNPAEILVGVDESKGDVQAAVDQHLPAVASELGTSAQVTKTNDVLSYATVELADADPATQQAAIDSLSDRPDVRYAEKNGTYRALYTPNDPEFSNQYAPQMVNAPEAWNTTMGDSSVTIAVLDTGIKYDHPDLADNMSNLDSNHGHDFVDNDDDPYPVDLVDEYHGTHVAGIAAAVTDNNEGIAGISNSSILAVRVLNEFGSGSWDGIADGIQYAADQGADIINMSLGGSSGSDTIKNAVAYAHSHGVLIVASAGNDYRSSSGYPAAYEECISVSSLNDSGDLSTFSNVGKAIELSAPGSSVLSTWTNDDYHSISGTSMAAPVVAGVAALAISAHGISGEELRRHLRETASDIGLTDGEQGYGMVDAEKAVTTSPQENYHDHVGENWAGTGTNVLRLENTDTSGTTRGLLAVSNSPDGQGIYGVNTTTSTTSPGEAAMGVSGVSHAPHGNGIFGTATHETGPNFGLRGESKSSQGTGLYGVARADSGETIGVRGASMSPDGQGLVGQNFASSGDAIGVYGMTQSPDGYAMYSSGDLHVQGDFTASGTKNFVQTVSTDAGTRNVAYTAVEADTPHTETSGVAHLENGRAAIDLPEHFGLVTSEMEDLVVQLTPYGGTQGLKVVERSTEHIVVETLGEDDDYEFSYTVRGTRAGYEDKQVVSEPTGPVTPDGPTIR